MTRRLIPGLVAATALVVSGTIATAQRQPESSAHSGAITEGLDCVACHTPEGWSMGGGASGEGGFDHSRTGFPLSGRHRTVGCTTCHAPDRPPRRQCVSCHADNHQGRLGRSCDNCHSAQGWARTRAIDMHRLTRLPLTGMHVLADCTECHQRTDERSYSSAPSECFACHERDYRDPAVHPSHEGRGGSTPFSRDCALCHRASGWAPAILVDPTALRRTGGLVAPSEHDMRFPISFGPHRGAGCESCHASLAVPQLVRCTGCHAHNPVRVRLLHGSAAAPLSGSACLSCHPGGSAR